MCRRCGNPNCRGKGSDGKHRHVNTPVNISGKTRKSSHKVTHLNDQREYDQADKAAILMMALNDDITDNRIYFNIGQAHKNKFLISDSGSALTFKISGLYYISFEGVLVSETEKLNIEFKRTPSFDDSNFSTFEVSQGAVQKNTLLKFNKGDKLEITVSCNGTSGKASKVAVSKGTSLIVFKVDDAS